MELDLVVCQKHKPNLFIFVPVSASGANNLALMWEVLTHEWFGGDGVQQPRGCRDESLIPMAEEIASTALSLKYFFCPCLQNLTKFICLVFVVHHRFSLLSQLESALKTSLGNAEQWHPMYPSPQKTFWYQMPSKVLKRSGEAFSLLF